MVKNYLEQGMIIKIEGIKDPVLVVSKDYYNQIGQIIGCPVVKTNVKGAIYREINNDEVTGTILCDQVRNFDINLRGYSIISKISMEEKMIISDIIQGLFDYV